MTEPSSRWGQMFGALLSHPAPAASTQGTSRAFNPHPPGSLMPDATPAAVLRWLGQRPGVQCRLATIASGIGRPTKTTSWALICLRQKGLVESRFVASNVAVWWLAAACETATHPTPARPPSEAPKPVPTLGQSPSLTT